MSTYKIYPQGTKVKIIATGQTGEAFEKFAGYVSVFLDNTKLCEFFKIEEVEFL